MCSYYLFKRSLEYKLNFVLSTIKTPLSIFNSGSYRPVWTSVTWSWRRRWWIYGLCEEDWYKWYENQQVVLN